MIKALPWVEDGADYTEKNMVAYITNMAEVSPRAFQALMVKPWIEIERGEPNGVDNLVVRYLRNFASFDESLTLKVMEMPFLATMDWEDSTNLRFLLDLARSDRPGLEKLLNHPDMLTRTGTRQRPHMALLYLETRDAGAARKIAALPWVQDGTPEFENTGVVLLQELALKSPKVFQAVLNRDRSWLPPQTGLDASTLERIISLSVVSEYAALQLIEMPFMEVMSVRDYEALRLLLDLAESDSPGLDFVLSHQDFTGGIMDEQIDQIPLLYLEWTDPDSARLIQGLSWVADGIAYWPDSNVSSIHDDLTRFESGAVNDLIKLSRWQPEIFLALVNKPWFQAKLTRNSYEAFAGLRDLAHKQPGATLKLLNMPFLDEVDEEDDGTLETLNDLYWDDAGKVNQLVDRLWAAGGLTDDTHFLVKYFKLEMVNSQAWEKVNALPWLDDGLQQSERRGIRALIYTATETKLLLPELLGKNWVKDGLTETESSAVWELAVLSSKSHARNAESVALSLLDMPFLESVEAPDEAALGALNRMLWQGEDDEGYLRRVLSHPELKGGIKDRDAMVIALLGGVGRRDPNLLDKFLTHGDKWLAHRKVDLPHTGTMHLAVLEESGNRRKTLDHLERAVRDQEGFMMEPYPSNFAAVLAADIPGGGGPSGIITVSPSGTDSPFLISSSAAYAYWPLYHPPWMSAGAVYMLSRVTAKEAFGNGPTRESIRCGPVRNLGELELIDNARAGEEGYTIDVPPPCPFDMGLAFYQDLYSSLGDKAFREGFRRLYLEAKLEGHDQACYNPERGLCLVRKSFVDAAATSKASVAETIIDRWYYGDPVGKD